VAQAFAVRHGLRETARREAEGWTAVLLQTADVGASGRNPRSWASATCTATCCPASTTGRPRWSSRSTTRWRRWRRGRRGSWPRRTSSRSTILDLPDRVHELRRALADERIRSPSSAAARSSRARCSRSAGGARGHRPRRPRARWLLYEVPFRGVDDQFLEGARELTERGFALLSRDPERSQGCSPAAHRAAAGPRRGRGRRRQRAPAGRRRGPSTRRGAARLRSGSPGCWRPMPHPPRRP